MTDKHTPGPWTVEIGDHGAIWGGYWQIDAEYDAVACNQSCFAGAQDFVVSMANARLIAAAPDMLALLQKVVAPFYGFGVGEMQRRSGLLSMRHADEISLALEARAIIKRIEGE